MNPPARPDTATELAAERTMLAWIRTGLALMGFGFVVAKFGLFLRRLADLQVGRAFSDHQTSTSVWLGVALVAAGVIVNVAAALRYRRLVENLRRGEAPPASSTALAFYLALAMAGIGVGIAIYLAALRA